MYQVLLVGIVSFVGRPTQGREENPVRRNESHQSQTQLCWRCSVRRGRVVQRRGGEDTVRQSISSWSQRGTVVQLWSDPVLRGVQGIVTLH